MSDSTKRIFPAAAAIAVIGAGSWYALGWVGRGDDTLHVSGNIEAVEVAISFKIPGRVEKRYVDEGDDVKEGQRVAQLETADLQADVALRRAELHAAQAAWEELKNGSRPDEIAAALAAMQKARANYDALKNGSRPAEIAASDAEASAAEADRKRLNPTSIETSKPTGRTPAPSPPNNSIGPCRVSNGQPALSPGEEAL